MFDLFEFKYYLLIVEKNLRCLKTIKKSLPILNNVKNYICV